MPDMPVAGNRSLFGGLPLSESDDTAAEWLAEARVRYDTDAEFHYRVCAVRQAMVAAYVNAPDTGHIAVALMIDEKVRKANGLR